jgi:hypothetical protein
MPAALGNGSPRAGSAAAWQNDGDDHDHDHIDHD